MTTQELFDALTVANLNPRRVNGQFMARCPVHDDRSPSLSATVKDGRLLLFCHAGCPFRLIVNALHLSPSERMAPVQRPWKPPPSDPAMIREWESIKAEGCGGRVAETEQELGIPAGGLARLGAAWSVQHQAIACPMRDAHDIIGVRLRGDDGSKWAVKGSRNGLFMPPLRGSGTVFIPEGLTDTAALVGLGLEAVGRPSCTGGREIVRSIFKDTKRPLIVVSDADEPGRNGADLLASELTRDGHRVRVLLPPPDLKDVREWVGNGATRASVEYLASLRSVWSPA